LANYFLCKFCQSLTKIFELYRREAIFFIWKWKKMWKLKLFVWLKRLQVKVKIETFLRLQYILEWWRLPIFFLYVWCRNRFCMYDVDVETFDPFQMVRPTCQYRIQMIRCFVRSAILHIWHFFYIEHFYVKKQPH
jgi:hypothetical protein